MLRTTLSRRAIALSRPFSTSSRVMAPDTGSTGSGTSRPTGERGGDAFTRRESASEEMWIRNEEKAKLSQLREKLQKQKEHIDKLTKDIDDIMKTSGGEHN